MDILKEIQKEEIELQTLVKDWGWQKLENFIEDLIKKDRIEQLSIQGVGCSSCEEIPKDSFYLGMSCDECNTPFRVVKNKQ